MPMFYTPKPRQFHYTPRLYDPEKEKLEELKRKYSQNTATETNDTVAKQHDHIDSSELEYFKQRVRNIDREQRKQNNKLTLKDLIRKRETPKFNYQPRFDNDGNLTEHVSEEYNVSKRIRRRFDDESVDGPQPVPAGKIIIYTLLVFLLISFIYSDVLSTLLTTGTK